MAELPLEHLARIVECGEADAYAGLFLPGSNAPGGTDAVRVERVGSAIAIITGEKDVVYLNRVLGLGVPEPATESTLETLIGLYRQAGIRNFAVQLCPSAAPSCLPEWLQSRGFKPIDAWDKLYRGLDPPPPVTTDLRVECISPAAIQPFIDLALDNFGLPPILIPYFEAAAARPGWRFYLAWADDRPVATGALFVQGSIGWLGFGSTLPAYRDRGAHNALLSQRIHDAAALGCSCLVTETTSPGPQRVNPSMRNLLRAGFKVAYTRQNYLNTLPPRFPPVPPITPTP